MGNSPSNFSSSTTAKQVLDFYKVDLTGKNVFITGANSGIGLESAKVLAQHKANIYFGARSSQKVSETEAEIKKAIGMSSAPKKEDETIKKEEEDQKEEDKNEEDKKEENQNDSSASDQQVVKGYVLSLSSLKSIQQCAGEFGSTPLSLLLNNAGVMACPYEKTEDGFETQIGTNHFGHFYLTNLLLANLKAGAPARVVNVASLAHKWGQMNWDDINYTQQPTKYDKWQAYGQSKLSNMLFSYELNRRYEKDGIQSFSLHPGVIATNLTRHSVPSALSSVYSGLMNAFSKNIPQGAATSMYCAVSPDITALGGSYFSDCKREIPTHPQFTSGSAIRLWAISEKAVGLESTPLTDLIVRNPDLPEGLEEACFGGGCFWGMEKWFKKEFPALKKVKVGYLGGSNESPSYKQVCTGKTGHAEVVYIWFDPNETKYEDLVNYFFRIHDPTTLNRQGNDSGSQYRSAIFFYSAEQQTAATKVKDELAQSDKMKKYSQKSIVTEITPASAFYVAEDHHQQYLDNNPNGYCNHKPRW